MTDTLESPPSEGRLVEVFRRERTAASFEPLVRLHGDRVHGVLFNLVMNPEDADDLAQDTWVVAFEQFERYSGGSTFSTWVCGIAVKKGLQFLRTQKRRHVLLEENAFRLPLQSTAASPDRELAGDEEHARVSQALAQLPELLRAAITLSAIEGMTPPEIAKACGCSVPVVYWRLHAARKRLSRMLKGKVPYAK